MSKYSNEITEISKIFRTADAAKTTIDEMLERVSRAAADLIGDGCIISLLEGESLVSGACALRDRGLENAYRDQMNNMRVDVDSSFTVSAWVIRTGAPKFEEVIPEQLTERTDEEHKSILNRLHVHSYAVVPIRDSQKIIGTFCLMRNSPFKPYTSLDVQALVDFASQLGLALERIHTRYPNN